MNRTGAFLSVIEWPRTLRYISWTSELSKRLPIKEKTQITVFVVWVFFL